VLIKYKLREYNSYWIRKVDSLSELIDDLTDCRGAFKSTEGKRPNIESVVWLREDYTCREDS